MFEEFTDKIAVNCRTEQEAKELLDLLYENGYVWFGGEKPTDQTNWETYKAKTCYGNDYNGSIGVEFCYSDYYKQHGYKILTYPEFLKLIGKEKTEVKGHLEFDGEDFGVVGEKTPFKDIDGERLFIGDVVENSGVCFSNNNVKSIVVKDNGKYFVMGIACDCDNKTGSLGNWIIKKLKSYKDLKDGEIIHFVKVCFNKLVQHPTILKHIIDGNKTVVVLSDKRTGVAWCSPEDKFDTLTGLNLAFKRAIGEEKPSTQSKAKKKEEIKVGDWVKLVDENALFYPWSDRAKQAAKRGVKVIQKDGFAILIECFYEKGRLELWNKSEAFVKIPAPKGGAK